MAANTSILKWQDEEDHEDFCDALDHCNLVRQRQMTKALGELEVVDVKFVAPEKILPSASFKGKEKGWLARLPEQEWETEFKAAHGRSIAHILKQSKGEGIAPVIVLDSVLGDGFGRTILAFGLGEEVMACFYEEPDD